MSLFAQAVALGRAGRPAEGVALVERAAAAGDAEGNLILAHWYLYGSDRPRDIGVARACLEKAAQRGSSDAVRVLANVIAGGIGCPPDWDKAINMLGQIAGSDAVAAEQVALLPRMLTEEDARDAKRELLSAEPLVEVVKHLLLPDECAYLIRRGEPLLKPSLVYDPATPQGKPDPIRTSHGAAFLPHDADLVIQRINQRLAIASGTDVHQGEALYVMRYAPGQQYRPHHDALPGLKTPRIRTAIAYLNSGYEGGATDFPDLSISVRSEAGDVLVFQNTDAEGQPHPLMRHAGQPVTSGAKWIATRWIRGERHDPYDTN
jgi:prolyl 4-hydroxylase